MKHLLFFMPIFIIFSACKKESSCNDGILNGDETQIDCGGDCLPCGDCFDGIQNGVETGVDCGGNCSQCPSCDDNIQNGDETGIDCGGSCGYCIGDTGPGNGVIFYDRGPDASGWRYLEAAPSDQAEAVTWGHNTNFVGNTSTAIGSGKENCISVLDQGILIGSAIHLCAVLDIGGESDWFLPSKEELLLMYDNKSAIGQFTTGAYWSSSEVTALDAWLVEFSNRDTYDEFKTREIRVRAIRRF